MTVAATAPTGRPRPGELAVVAAGFGLLVVVAPNVEAFAWTPKVVLLLLTLGPGLVALAVAAASRDRAALAGAAFVVAAALATIAAPDRTLALVGLYNDGTGWLFVAATVGLWALGRRLGPGAGRLLGTAVIVAAVLNAVVTWVQMSSAFDIVLMTRVDGRPPGLAGNPVHASALILGGLVLVIERWPARRAVADPARRADLMLLAAIAGVLASGLQLTGGRLGLALAVAVMGRLVVRSGWRRAVPALVAVGLGVGFASLAFRSGGDATTRISASSSASGLSGRIDEWRLAGPAIADRPWLGSGPGLYRRATSPHTTVAAARANGSDRLFRDGHNLFVEYAVTTGVVGLLALLAWLVLAAVGVRGELAWFAGFAGIGLLLQPQYVGLTPVLALALGAAGPRLAPRLAPVAVVIAAGLGVAGLGAGLVLVRGDLAFGAAGRTDPTRAHRAATLLRLWPEPALTEARVAERVGRPRRAAIAADEARARDPSDPQSALVAGGLAVAAGRPRAAWRAYEDAWTWNPQSTTALNGLAYLARERGDLAASRTWCQRLHRVAPRAPCPVRPG